MSAWWRFKNNKLFIDFEISKCNLNILFQQVYQILEKRWILFYIISRYRCFVKESKNIISNLLKSLFTFCLITFKQPVKLGNYLKMFLIISIAFQNPKFLGELSVFTLAPLKLFPTSLRLWWNLIHIWSLNS